MNKLYNGLREIIKSPVIVFYFILLLCLFIEYSYFALSLGGYGNNNFVTLCKCFGDCTMVLIFYWILPKKFSWINIVIIWLLSIFFMSNLWYFRFWGQMITPLFYRLWKNLNGDTIASVKALFSVFDSVFIVLPTVLTVIYFMGFKDKMKNDMIFVKDEKICRLVMILVTIVFFMLSQVAYAVTKSYWNRAAGFRDQSVVDNLITNLTKVTNASAYDLATRGLPIFLYSAFVNIAKDLAFSQEINPNPDEMAELDKFITSVPKFPYIEEFASNEGKNVVILLVESLNADVINKSVNGHEVTPFLNSLMASEGVVSALEIIPQVKDGCSNDGQLLTNTGLLPLSKGVVSMSLGQDVVYPALPKLLKHKSSVAIFGDAGLSWNQTLAYKGYGFDEVYTVLDFKDSADCLGADAAMFDFSNAVLDTIRQPFLLEFVTFSMHAPFSHKSIKTKEWLSSSGLDANEINYLNSANYTDFQINKFFGNLQKRGLLQSTVVFIASDHSQTLGLNKGILKDIDEDALDLLPMVFIAVNSGKTQKIEIPAGQVNVFPTILHILNIGNEKYHGLDRSLIDPELSTSVSSKGTVRGSGSDYDINRQKRAWEVSDSLLRSNFFSR